MPILNAMQVFVRWPSHTIKSNRIIIIIRSEEIIRLFQFRYIIAGLSTGCLIVFNVNFNVLSQPRREPGTPTSNIQ